MKNDNFKSRFNQRGDNRYYRKRTGKFAKKDEKDEDKTPNAREQFDNIRDARKQKTPVANYKERAAKYAEMYNNIVKKEIHYTLTGNFKCAILGKHVVSGKNSMAKGNCVIVFETNEPNVVVVKANDGRMASVKLTSDLIIPMAWK